MAEWCVQTKHARLSPDWEIRNECATFEEARGWAQAHRGDGFKARLQKWCPVCASYTTSYLGDRCEKCKATPTLNLSSKHFADADGHTYLDTLPPIDHHSTLTITRPK